MNELFGIPISAITICVAGLLAVALATTGAIAIADRTSFQVGVRNVPRRPEQTVLIVFGLMLATLIVTAAFSTGDTIDHSLTKGSYDLFQRSDLDITWTGERAFGSDVGATQGGASHAIDGTALDALEAAFAGDDAIAGFLPALNATMAATGEPSGLSSPSVRVAGYDPARLSQFGGLTLTSGDPAELQALADGSVYVSERAAGDLAVEAGDRVTLHGPNGPATYTVAGVVRDELASGVFGLQFSTAPGGVAMPLPAARSLLGVDPGAISALTVVLAGDVRSTVNLGDAPAERLQSFIDANATLFAPYGEEAEVFTAKHELIDLSEKSGNQFTTLFLVLGLFSMSAGVLLIFMIFVMLASERRAEMGIARAIGAQRSHLVRSFVAEGMTYSLLAGLVGVPLGILAALGLTNVLLPMFGGDYFSIVEAHVTWRSAVIGYGLGVVITFSTVVLAALKVTHVNIVAAVRNLPDAARPSSRRRIRWGWVLAGVPALIVPPLGLWWMLRKGFGLQWTWLLAPAGIAAGLLLMAAGRSGETLFPFALGISLLPVCAAALVTPFGFPRRLAWTTVGVLLLTYWFLPPAQHEDVFGHFESDIEMFVLAGIMIVVGATLVVVFNAGTLVGLFAQSSGSGTPRAPLALGAVTIGCAVAGFAFDDAGNGAGQLGLLAAGVLAPTTLAAWAAGRFPHLAPALKMAVAYPLANRFRTGMTIAMFSLIVFSLTVMSVLLANFSVLEGGAEARGNLDIVATASDTSPRSSLGDLLAADNSAVAGDVLAEGRTSLETGAHEARVAGGEWEAYPVLAADDAFLGALAPALDARAEGFDSDQAVLDAVRSDPSLAIIDRFASGKGFSIYSFNANVTTTDGIFTPFDIEVRDNQSGAVRTLKVVGVLRTNLPSTIVAGVFVNERAYEALSGEPLFRRSYLRVADASDARAIAQSIESTLATRGIEADAVTKLLDDQNAQVNAFNRMFQAFMGLGLFVGIAGLGVIAFRAVVERRQQIGMLRAIGYQRSTVALTYLFESGFIAVMGIMCGVVGGTVLARNLLTSEAFTEGGTITLRVPWAELGGVAIISLAVSLAMTWWPSRGASKVPVAEALRYE